MQRHLTIIAAMLAATVTALALLNNTPDGDHVPEAAKSPTTAHGGPPSETTSHLHTRGDPDGLISFNDFSSSDCSDSSFLKTHLPYESNTCYSLGASEKGFGVYYQAEGCTRKHKSSGNMEAYGQELLTDESVHEYTDSQCQRGDAYATTLYACYDETAYYSYQVLCSMLTSKLTSKR